MLRLVGFITLAAIVFMSAFIVWDQFTLYADCKAANGVYVRSLLEFVCLRR